MFIIRIHAWESAILTQLKIRFHKWKSLFARKLAYLGGKTTLEQCFPISELR